eukprot:TRINITY_DN52163_c0_g1_i2.p1 TRINITY_DN52163_c0_g1~~TRINITY_DN52163_c0_g1_i2.p1  ORF type:complete len:311 (-),score=75.89 TRINITY_DN52163_c0_g1_i2:96-1028(-)
MSDVQSMFRQAKAKMAAKKRGVSTETARLQQQIEKAKRQKLAQTEAKANVQNLLPKHLQPKKEEAPTQKKQQQRNTMKELLASGFFDNPDDVQVPQETTNTPTQATSSSSSTQKEEPAGDQLPDSKPDERKEGRQGKTGKAKPNELSKALPKGFFDDEKKDAKVRNQAQQMQEKLKKEHEKLLAEISRDEEKNYELNQEAAEQWNTQREMDECFEMMSTYERYHHLYQKSKAACKQEQEENDAKVKAETTEETANDDNDDQDSDDDDDALMGGYTWRTKKVPTMTAAQVRLKAIRESIKEEKALVKKEEQ